MGLKTERITVLTGAIDRGKIAPMMNNKKLPIKEVKILIRKNVIIEKVVVRQTAPFESFKRNAQLKNADIPTIIK